MRYFLLFFSFRPAEGVKIAATDEEAKAADANNNNGGALPMDIDSQANDIIQ
jgi:hypothetical protein